VTTSVVAFVVRKGNPKNIHTWSTLLNRHQGPHAEPVHLRRRQVEPAGRLRAGVRRRARIRAAGLAYVHKLLTEHVPVQDKSGREGTAGLHLRQRRRPPLLRVRGHDRARRRARRSTTCCRTTRSRSTSTSRRRPRRRPRPRRSSTTCSPSRPGALRGMGLPAVNQEVLDANKSRFPNPSGAVHDR
jgi:sulfate transport system substrate-binding protein